MNKDRAYKFGDLRMPGGAIYGFDGEAGAIESLVQSDLDILEFNGVPKTPLIETMVRERVVKDREEFFQKTKGEGIPPQLVNLLQATSKKTLKSLAKATRIEYHDLFRLFVASDQIGLSHRSQFHDFSPSESRLSREDFLSKDSSPDEIKKFTNKVNTLMAQRKRNMVHLLEGEEKWHLIWFTYSDASTTGQQHWEFGPHVHFVNYLWPEFEKEELWSRFATRNIRIPNSLHIRCNFSDED